MRPGAARPADFDAVARIVYTLAVVLSGVCLIAFAALVLFDAQAERLTAGRPPSEFSARLDGRLRADYGDVTVIAHNAGDSLAAATRAVAYGTDGIEIDVRSTGGELFATHDAPLPLLEDLVFRGPSLAQAWDIARLRATVLLHLKQRSPGYLDQVRTFLASRRLRRVLVQAAHPETLRALKATDRQVTPLLLVFSPAGLQALQRDPSRLRGLAGVSVKDDALTPAAIAWLRARHLLVFAWTVNDEQRLNELVAAGVSGVITDRLDIMRLLGTGQVAPA